MTNKKIIIITSLIIGFILLFFLFYLIFIRPVVRGDYMPSQKDCTRAYDCLCLNDACNCSYKKWGIENKMVCKKENLKKSQMQ